MENHEEPIQASNNGFVLVCDNQEEEQQQEPEPAPEEEKQPVLTSLQTDTEPDPLDVEPDLIFPFLRFY